MPDYILEVTDTDGVNVINQEDHPVILETPCNQQLPAPPLERGVTIATRSPFVASDNGKLLFIVVEDIVVTKINIQLSESFFDDSSAKMSVYSGAIFLVNEDDLQLQSSYEFEFDADVEITAGNTINLGINTMGIRGKGFISLEYYKL